LHPGVQTLTARSHKNKVPISLPQESNVSSRTYYHLPSKIKRSLLQGSLRM
jgi:hypothetical protein